jgi:FkbM family methyltransferase
MLRLERICVHSFLRSPLDAASVVVDCGVNRGSFSRWIAENVGCTIHGFEPDPRFYERLPRLAGAQFHNLAVSHRAGLTTFNLGEALCSSLHFREEGAGQRVEVETVTLPEFLAKQGVERVDLLKLDIEGAELPVLEHTDGAFFRDRVAQLTVEFHDHKDPGAIPTIRRVIERLEGLGFLVVPFTYFGFGDVLFANRRLLGLNRADELQIHLTKHRWGARRLLARFTGTPAP